MAAQGLSVSGQGLTKAAISKTASKPRGKLLLNPKNPLVDAATAFALIEEKLSSRYKSVKQAFINMDYDLDGRISSGEFRVTLDLMGLVMTDDEFVKLWAHFDVDGSGELNYAEFNNKVGAMLHPPITRHVINRPQTPRVRQVNARKAAQGLKKRMANLADAFKMIDSDGSGRISHAEFIQALRHVGLTKISHDESYEMMVKFKDAEDMEDGISFPQFKKAMESYLKVAETQADAEKIGAFHQEPTVALNHAEKLLAEKLWGKFSAVQRAFRSFDSDKSGDLSYEEFRAALRSLGVHLTDPDFRELVAKYDLNGDGAISYDEFNSQVGSLIHPSAINTNKLHETMMKQAGAQSNALHFNKDAKLGLAALGKRQLSLSEKAGEIAGSLGLKIGETLFAQQLCGRYKELARRFREADDNNSGELDYAEFRQLTQDMGLHLSDKHIEEIMLKYDTSGNNSISYDELTAKLGFLLQGSEVARQALGVPVQASSATPSPRTFAKHIAEQEAKKPDIDWDAMSFDDSASVASVSTSAVDVGAVEARMRKVLGRNWMKAYKNLRSHAADGTVESDRFRDAMAGQGVALTSKEVRALQRQHGAASSGGLHFDDVMKATFSRSHK